MNEFQAAMGICNLRHLHEEIEKRKKATELYNRILSGVCGLKIPQKQNNIESNYSYYPVFFDEYKYTRNEIVKKLREADIDAEKYYFPLTNSFDAYKNYLMSGQESTPVAQRVAQRILPLPLYADIKMEDINRICEIILH